MEVCRTIIDENREYWTGRAVGYSEVNRLEFATIQRKRWKNCLQRVIGEHFPNQSPESIRVLDIGTGPGFFAVLLCESGYRVTAVDLTEAMLKEAAINAGSLAGRIRFLEMDAEALTFEDACFDVVVSRNLTWNLPHPERAYSEWVRVLKPSGLMVNFDANWYAYLFDEEAHAAYRSDRVASSEAGIPDQNVGENFDVMEDIAQRIPLSAIRRPGWDQEVLRGLGMSVSADEKIWKQVWSEEEKINFASTPMFMIRGIKKERET